MKLIYFDAKLGIERISEIVGENLANETSFFVRHKQIAADLAERFEKDPKFDLMKLGQLNPKIDSILYRFFQRFSLRLLDHLVDEFRPHFAVLGIVNINRKAVAQILSDILVADVRNLFELNSQGITSSDVLVFAKEPNFEKFVVSSLQDKPVEIADLSNCGLNLKNRSLRIEKIGISFDADVLFVTNTFTPQYCYNALPVVAAMSDLDITTNILSSRNDGNFSVYSETQLLDPGRISKWETVDFIDLKPIISDDKSQCSSSIEVLEAAIINFIHKSLRETGWNKYSLAIYNSIARKMLSLMHRVSAIEELIVPIVKASELVMVEPGRMSMSIIAVDTASRLGIPTIELQSGTIASSPRYRRPDADYVLSMDDFSSRVYSDGLLYPKETILKVGLPKIDYDLQEARKYDYGECVDQVKAEVGREGPYIFLATQPAGLDVMREVVTIIADAAKRKREYTFVIRQHPGEDEAYKSMYKKIFAKRKLGNVVMVDDTPTYRLLVACDCLLTYFSTLGVEGYAMGKPVFAINPFEHRPAYDLVQIGVAERVKSSEDLVVQLEEVLSDKGKQVLKGEEVLRDGKAAERCAEFVEDLINKRAIEQMRQRNAARKRWSLKRLVGQS